MKIKLLICLMVLLFSLPAVALPPKGFTSDKALIVDNTTWIDANRILMFVTNHGNFGRDLGGYFGYDYGTFYPYIGDYDLISDGVAVATRSPYYAGGIWVAGLVDGQIRAALSEYSSEYVPGPMVNGTFSPDEGGFHVYKLYRDSMTANPNQDYLGYVQNAIPDGAPYLKDSLDVAILDGDGNMIPELFGDQMCWSVFNDADPSQHTGVDGGETDPLGIEVKQTIFAFTRDGSLGDMVFLRLRIYNKGVNTIENCYFSIWSDPDVGGSADDLVGCDTTLGLGYCYQATDDDTYYGDGAPAIGIDFFQGPFRAAKAEDIANADPSDTTPDGELVLGRMWGKKYTDSVNVGMVSFNKYINGTDPDDYVETYRYMRGLNADGTPYSYSGNILLYQKSGDPVTGVGDVDDTEADRRFMQTTGPVTFAPGDSTEILAGMIFGIAGSGPGARLDAITKVKDLDAFAQQLYLDGFNPPKPPAAPVVDVRVLDDRITLLWNDTSEVEPGDFIFEGYSVWQTTDPASGEWELLQTWDLINDLNIAVVDSIPNTVLGTIIPVNKRSVTNSGLSYSYTTATDNLSGEVLHPITEYYFRVSAFSFAYSYVNSKGDTLTVANGDRFLESATLVSVKPEAPSPGTHITYDATDTLIVTHVGPSIGSVTVEVVDPLALTGHDYQVLFKDTAVAHNGIANTTIWYLYDVTADTILLDNQVNQGDAEDEFWVVDGFKVTVAGPAVRFSSFQVVANGAGVIDPPEAGAADFQDFPTGVDADGDPLRPTDAQQVGAGHWFFHTGDNGGTSGGGTRGSYEAFLTRIHRDDPARLAQIKNNDFEMRFTGESSNPGVGGSYAWEWATTGESYWVPFELWRIGQGTPDDPSDDVRLLPCIYGDGDAEWNMASYGSDANGTCGPDGCEHSASGGDDDPFTNWVYWKLPEDDSPGEAGYLAFEAEMISDPVNADIHMSSIFGRTVLVNWNGHTYVDDTLTNPAVFNQDEPELGTIFRINTFKGHAPVDTFSFSTEAPTYTSSENDLDNVKAVPNPFYLYGGYDPSPGSKKIAFHHLPATCTISIFNLAGDLVKTITKDDPNTSIDYWDVSTDEGLPVASGIYIYVVESTDFGTKIGKMAVFVEAEVLNIY